MNMKETERILASVTAVYPAFAKDRDCHVLATVWQQVFSHVPYAQVNRALAAFFAGDVKGYPPTPGAVNAYLLKARKLEGPTENDAWALVLKASSRGLYNSREEYEKLPEDVREIVGSPRMLHEWAQMSTEDLNTSVAPGFKRAWTARQELKQELEPYFRLEGADMKLLE